MTLRLNIDCLTEIIEYLEKDKFSLGSCLLVDRIWCNVAVRILWRNVWDVNRECQTHASLSILSTLNACLPNESENLLNEKTPTPKLPLFNYVSFIQTLSLHKIEHVVEDALGLIEQYTLNNKRLTLQELLKGFMNQVSSIKVLSYYSHFLYSINNIPFASFPGAKDCLKDVIEFRCNSSIY